MKNIKTFEIFLNESKKESKFMIVSKSFLNKILKDLAESSLTQKLLSKKYKTSEVVISRIASEEYKLLSNDKYELQGVSPNGDAMDDE